MVTKNMQNEPNLLNAKMNLNPVRTTYYVIFRRLQHRKNEPNTNPIFSTDLSIYAIAYALGGKYLCVLGGFEQKMQNEPNFKNTKINVNLAKKSNYDNFYPFDRSKNEPNLFRF